jgi:hypothetical protein
VPRGTPYLVPAWYCCIYISRRDHYKYVGINLIVLLLYCSGARVGKLKRDATAVMKEAEESERAQEAGSAQQTARP